MQRECSRFVIETRHLFVVLMCGCASVRVFKCACVDVNKCSVFLKAKR